MEHKIGVGTAAIDRLSEALGYPGGYRGHLDYHPEDNGKSRKDLEQGGDLIC